MHSSAFKKLYRRCIRSPWDNIRWKRGRAGRAKNRRYRETSNSISRSQFFFFRTSLGFWIVLQTSLECQLCFGDLRFFSRFTLNGTRDAFYGPLLCRSIACSDLATRRAVRVIFNRGTITSFSAISSSSALNCTRSFAVGQGESKKILRRNEEIAVPFHDARSFHGEGAELTDNSLELRISLMI